MTDAECAKKQSDCRKEIFGAMFPRWAAVATIGAFVAILGVLFTLALSARSEASEAKGVSACQERDIVNIAKRLDGIDGKLDRLLDRQLAEAPASK